MLRSPFKWVGGKSKLRRKIIELMPPHEFYIEVFGGAGWVLLGKEPAAVEVFNDIDSDVVNFFRVVRQEPEQLIDSFKWDLVSREVFQKLLDTDPSGLSDVERAHRFYYLIMAAWGGEWRLPRFQTSVQDAGHGNRLIGALKNLSDRVMPVHNRLRTVIIENLSWQECIERYDRPYDRYKTLMYFDPPYPDNNVNYVHNMRSTNDHEDFFAAILQLESRFILTTYDTPETNQWVERNGLFMMNVDFPAGMPNNGNKSMAGKRHRNQELIITNYDFRVR